MRLRILGKHIIQNRVGNLIADLVWMPLRYRLSGNQFQFSHLAAPFTNAPHVRPFWLL